MPYAIGDIAEPFTLPRAGGAEVRIDPTTAPATVVVWTCNHCPYALAWHDRLQALIRDYTPAGVQFAQVNANDAVKYPADSLAEMERRVAEGDFASPYLHDAEQSLSKRWGARVTPDVFVLDGDARVVYLGSPDGDHEDESQNASYVRDALDAVLSGRSPALQGTRAKGCKIKWTVDDQPNPYV